MITKSVTEYNKIWAKENPELFTSSVLKLLEDCDNSWVISISQSKGFVKITADLK